jgi:hypothetical protein
MGTAMGLVGGLGQAVQCGAAHPLIMPENGTWAFPVLRISITDRDAPLTTLEVDQPDAKIRVYCE